MCWANGKKLDSLPSCRIEDHGMVTRRCVASSKCMRQRVRLEWRGHRSSVRRGNERATGSNGSQSAKDVASRCDSGHGGGKRAAMLLGPAVAPTSRWPHQRYCVTYLKAAA